ncbi:MAG: class I SAM-dependent methyltransferase [Sphingomonadales bacterium]|nr:class I SAM-dependent methyltransferase [Sphingomonadales bacterium]
MDPATGEARGYALSSGGGDWIERPDCPACGGTGTAVGKLFKQDNHLGGLAAPHPAKPIELRRCGTCELVYKTLVASPALLERLTAQTQAGLWISAYDYAEEIALLRAIDPAVLDDVIDVGAAGGGFLRALAPARRSSALDIVRFASLRINGEFVKGFLDDPALEWSGEAYGLVGLFDVAEHFYDPPQAFANLRRFCRKGGLVILETGDSDAVSMARLPRWYYLNLLEHHIAWNRTSLAAIAAKHGFELASFERKVHKDKTPPGLRHRIKAQAFSLAPQLISGFYRLLGKPFDVPADMAVDHMRVVLRAI